MAEAFWDKEVEIERFPKNERGEEIVVKKVEKKGKTFVDVRTFYPKGGEMLPSTKGLAIPDDIADAVAEAITKSAEVKI